MKSMAIRCGVLILLLLLSGCDLFDFKPSKSSIRGDWKAEPFDIGGIALPISPSLRITDDAIIMQGNPPETIPLESIDVYGMKVMLSPKGAHGAGLSFTFESRDRIYFIVPLIENRIYYDRQ